MCKVPYIYCLFICLVGHYTYGQSFWATIPKSGYLFTGNNYYSSDYDRRFVNIPPDYNKDSVIIEYISDYSPEAPMDSFLNHPSTLGIALEVFDSTLYCLLKNKPILEFLVLSGEGNKIDLDFSEAKGIRHLSLDNGALNEFPTGICNLHRLKHLDIYLNKQVVIPECFGDLDSLRYVWISDLDDTEIQSPLLRLEKLEELGYSTIAPIDLSNMSGYFNDLRVLFVNFKGTSENLAIISNLTKLTHLSITYSELLKLAPEDFQILHNVKHILVDDIPYVNNEKLAIPALYITANPDIKFHSF